jgi:uncharacterized protein
MSSNYLKTFGRFNPKFLNLCYLFLATSLFVTNSVTAQSKYQEQYDSSLYLSNGVELYEKGKYAESIVEFEKVAKTDPNFLKAQYEKLMSLRALEKTEEQKTLLESLYNSKLMSDAPELLLQYGIFLSDAKEYDEAEKRFKEAENFIPNSSMLHYNLAILYIRKEERQKSIDYLKKCILGNPNHASSQYFIGLLAYEDGRIVEGSLAMLSYLANAPSGRFAKDAILKLNSKMGQNFLEKPKYVFSEKGDQFDELETILRNQLPLNAKYKIKSKIDDVITRQVQAILEYAPTHKVGNGFFEQNYIPWLADIAKKNYTEAFTYYILMSMEEVLGKKLTSEKKKIFDFAENYIGKQFWENYAQRTITHFGKEEKVVVYLRNGDPFLIGKSENGVNQGKFKVVNNFGQQISEINYLNGELDGLQKYFFENGSLSEETFFAKGIKNGETKEYFKNGNLQSVGTYKNNLLDGSFVTYHPNGGKQCELTFKNEKREGLMTCYYPNGKKRSEITYKDGLINGWVINYNEVGDITSKYNYVNDELEGEGITYFDGKTIKMIATYSKGKIKDSLKEYFENEQLKKESWFVNGSLKKEIEYFENGVLSSEAFYDDKGLLENYTYYDRNGEKYFEEKYKSGELKMGYQYVRNNPKPTEVPVNNKAYVIKTLDGKVLVNGFFEKGKMNKEWTYYNRNGNIKTKQTIQNNISNGIRHDYNTNGDLVAIYNNSNGAINGFYEGFSNGKVNRSFYFKEGERNGPYVYYYDDGTVSYEGYLLEDDKAYKQYNYTQDGKLSRINHYQNDVLIKTTAYTKKGVIENERSFTNLNGEQKHTESEGVIVVTNSYVNGVKQGKGNTKDKNGTLIADANYENGEYNGPYKSYHPSEKLAFESNYYAGKIHGTENSYDLAGNLRLTRVLKFGKEFGPIVRYYQSKQKLYEYLSLDDTKDKEQIFYNHKGEAVAAVGYQLGSVIYYRVLNQNKTLGDPINVSNGTFEIKSNYPNGKKAFYLKFVKEHYEDNMEIHSEDGKPCYISGFKNGVLHGDRIEYYANGNMYKKERLNYGDYQGIQEYYTEDAKPLIMASYNFDELHGEFKIYQNGVLKKTKKYDSDDLVEQN